jgi:CMP/dCMP kinase
MGVDRRRRPSQSMGEEGGRMIVAVDGPAASGKGTIARAIAAHHGLPHLDTGLLYRAVGLAVLRAGGDPASSADALAGCGFSDGALNDPQLKSEAAGKAASLLSTHPQVRAALLDRQRAFAAQPGGAVLDGRDIGTVVAPHADAKLFVTATSEIRATRRWRELIGMGLEVHYDAVLHDIAARDARDSSRSVAPLRMADDAQLLDTTALERDQAIAAALALVDKVRHHAAND